MSTRRSHDVNRITGTHRADDQPALPAGRAIARISEKPVFGCAAIPTFGQRDVISSSLIAPEACPAPLRYATCGRLIGGGSGHEGH